MTLNGKKLQKSASGNTALDKESIVELMKTVFEEEFAKQQQQISKIIENNLVITKQEIEKLREEINDLKKVMNLLKMLFRRNWQKLSRTFASYKENLRKLRPQYIHEHT